MMGLCIMGQCYHGSSSHILGVTDISRFRVFSIIIILLLAAPTSLLLIFSSFDKQTWVRQGVWELGASSKGSVSIRGGLTSSTRSPIRVTNGRSLLLDLPTPRVSFLRKSVLRLSSLTLLSVSVLECSLSRTERRLPLLFPTMVA